MRIRSRPFIWTLVAVTVALMCDATTAAADSKSQPDPTPAERAFHDALLSTGRAYVDCLTAAFSGFFDVSVVAAQAKCADQGKAYAAYLPAEQADALLQSLAEQVKNKS